MKKSTIIGILAIIILAVISGFLVWKNNQRETTVDKRESLDSIENKSDLIKIQNDTKFGTRLTEEEIASIKNNNFFIWYEIPELGIKFKVTPDSKEDLKYIVNKHDKQGIYLYSKSIVEFLKCENLIDCSEGSLGKVSTEKNLEIEKNTGIPSCRKEGIVANVANDLICLTGSQAPVLTGVQYENYLKLIGNRKFGIYLNTAESIE
ncbi:MAG: hypothetical protein M0P97_00250 [Candidatus Moranbacteria bacterium]|jgi:hypothetical protein|nr:hypothetical protein [Candidatus Moranbacteria bacterium]